MIGDCAMEKPRPRSTGGILWAQAACRPPKGEQLPKGEQRQKGGPSSACARFSQVWAFDGDSRLAFGFRLAITPSSTRCLSRRTTASRGTAGAWGASTSSGADADQNTRLSQRRRLRPGAQPCHSGECRLVVIVWGWLRTPAFGFSPASASVAPNGRGFFMRNPAWLVKEDRVPLSRIKC